MGGGRPFVEGIQICAYELHRQFLKLGLLHQIEKFLIVTLTYLKKRFVRMTSKISLVKSSIWMRQACLLTQNLLKQYMSVVTGTRI